ncbi:MAG TPA: HD domain-containing protein [Anaerolineae bacterium]|nr:HD domain-containing protein [Anaerolineae bacterium]HQK14091.1 HD domain-containing protein [Anaerolineae bacterium]
MVTWARVRYRVAQFFVTLWTSRRAVDLAYVERHLGPALLDLFRRMPHAEQHHGIAVCRALEVRGYSDPDLLAAALLHDVGKILAPPRLWDRVIAVLGEHFLPQQAARWRIGEARGWRRGFVVRHYHPVWGATLAEQAGASPRTVVLIRHHHDPAGDDAEMKALQMADGG